MTKKLLLASTAALMTACLMPVKSIAGSIYINASGPVPTMTTDDWAVFGPGYPSLWGPSTITYMAPNEWHIDIIVAGGSYAAWGSSNRGLDLIDPVSGKLLDSMSFNYWSRNGDVDLVLFDAYLYTSAADGTPANESARCPSLCATSDYTGGWQLVMAGMQTSYTTLNVYLIGTAPVATANAPEPASLTLLGMGLLGVGLIRRRRV